MELKDLFVGPLGRASLDAARFTSGMMDSFALMEVLERVEALDKILEGDIDGIERKVAEQLKDELYNSVLLLAAGACESNGKAIKEKVL